MKKLLVITVILVMVVVFPTLTFAAGDMVNGSLTRSQARWNLAKKIIGLGAGFIAGGLFHEIGHYTVAKIEGMKSVRIYPTKVTYRYKEYSKTKSRNISLGGFEADILSSEILLSSDKHFP